MVPNTAKTISAILVIAISLTKATVMPGQAPSGKFHKNILVEIGGTGRIMTINYDMRLKRGVQGAWGIRAGIGASLGFFEEAPKVKSGPGIISIPLEVNYLFGKRRSFFETGFALTPIHVNYEKISIVGDNFLYGPRWAWFALAKIGYRFQPLHHGVMFGVNIVGGRWPGGYISGSGITLGYGFK